MFMKLIENDTKIVEDKEDDDIEEKSHRPMGMDHNTIDMSNPNRFKSERISYGTGTGTSARFVNEKIYYPQNNNSNNMNDTYGTSQRADHVLDNKVTNAPDYHKIKAFNKSNITIEDSDVNSINENVSAKESDNEFAQEFEEYNDNTSSASEIPELPDDIGPPPQSKINENIHFEA